ncbi:uroporphyrin-iii c/tetrapyrrole (corrin/porphyrin) methyltransferase, putative [Heliomicrobium modesticaldum Ice1]|uniref:Ribosomal RNA small subunit methyltransferase I n=1 Tax=Heliobacterium modesticaldum (strain ATCC 51547 / Ice1) TaxID=498761 RepID=B0TB73_HELMI|nr:16S rRNA (cytidine(1402)-2'-O)-methyltransferase [Heliomicrobium modesticaldum]ABZ83800.1 uroporphyrin-iii c/tetrapyrrole (corrin/porphyrin) methyltransferase, putative [Heliomicrobium modesticaldum Ice1]
MNDHDAEENQESLSEDRPAKPAGTGKLILCATPIGNLEDITLRVLKALREADLIAAEDTRHTRKLLSAFDIHVPLTSYHEHNRRQKGAAILDRVAEGATVALVSDAGLPGISDPGEDIVRECVDRGLPLEVLPGPTASLTALVLSGLPTSRFVFEGFLPRPKKEFRERLRRLAFEDRTMILYESPHRILETVESLCDALGADRPAALVRELTKKFEEVRRGSLAELAAAVRDGVRGECTLVIAGRSPAAESADKTGGTADLWNEATAGGFLGLPPLPEGESERAAVLLQRLRLLEDRGMDSKAALKAAAQELGIPRREAYRLRVLVAEAKRVSENE